MGLEGVTPREGHLQNLGHSKDNPLSPTVDPSTLQGLEVTLGKESCGPGWQDLAPVSNVELLISLETASQKYA